MDIAKFVFQARAVEGVIVVRQRLSHGRASFLRKRKPCAVGIVALIAITPEVLTIIAKTP